MYSCDKSRLNTVFASHHESSAAAPDGSSVAHAGGRINVHWSSQRRTSLSVAQGPVIRIDAPLAEVEPIDVGACADRRRAAADLRRRALSPRLCYGGVLAGNGKALLSRRWITES